MQQYVIYLRKSRADIESELHEEGETLARHEKILKELAGKLKLNITEIYQEVVSGETIAARPMMQRLLGEVEKGIWDGVLVMEVERLARGDTIDQGIMAQTFKYSNTKIITPLKTYDPNNEFDEEYFEFGLFMSRREYKTINRRLQRGRLASVKEGKYVSAIPPYGYIRKKLEHENGYTLVILPEQANVVRLIFEWYTKGDLQIDGSYRRIGVTLIAKKLNQLNIKSQKGTSWSMATIRDILTNPVYIGKIRWNCRPVMKRIVDGKVVKERPRSDNVLIVDGLHESILSDETFYFAQQLINRNKAHPIGEKKVVMNPLCGIIICGKCGRRIIRKPYSNKTKYETLMCPSPHCSNVSAKLDHVEDAILNALDSWFANYTFQLGVEVFNQNNIKLNVISSQLDQLEQESNKLHNQLNVIYELLEKGIYTSDQFIERSKLVTDRIKETLLVKESLSKGYEFETTHDLHNNNNNNNNNMTPHEECFIEIYRRLPTPQAKNNLLKEVLMKVEYIKERSARYKGVNQDDFTITLYPILPKKL